MATKQFVVVEAYTKTSVSVLINGQSYEYGADTFDIREFFRLLRRNQGRALTFIKDKCWFCNKK